ncbi:MAG: helix-turn-helix domain-containing protein [Alphaproteobacteria bacterium]|nr:helix-turn-helix domain-containing protein [Alphaproteobacteria bacterium]
MLPPKPTLKKPVTAVSRAAHILRYLGKRDTPAGVNAIAKDLDIVPSTCLHILRTLSHENLTVFDPATKRYRLGPAVLSLSRDALANSDFVREARPRLDGLAERHGVTVTATELDNAEHMVVVAIARARQNLSIHVNVGSRFPALISASGRCYAALSDWSKEELRERFSALQWQNPPRFNDWLKEVETARGDGYAIDRSTYLRGIVIAAAPVLDGEGRATRALAAIGFADQLAGKAALKLARDVKRAGDFLSE